jgi:RNA polymerase sigma-70 factor (ECF subfamily)
MNATLEQIWNDFSGRLRQFIQRRVSDPAVTEDILQDVFLKISTRIGQLKQPEKLQAWLFLIARNAVIDHYRTRKETVELSESLPAEDEIAPGELEGLKAAFRRMVHNLPEPYREAILLTEFEGVSQVELARRLGISVSGAKSRVQRGREQLKRMLEECCHFEVDRRGSVFDCVPRKKEACRECS